MLSRYRLHCIKQISRRALFRRPFLALGRRSDCGESLSAGHQNHGKVIGSVRNVFWNSGLWIWGRREWRLGRFSVEWFGWRVRGFVGCFEVGSLFKSKVLLFRVYNEITPSIALGGPTNFAPLIYQAIQICQRVQDVSYISILRSLLSSTTSW
jgi:hypothetical protein